MRKPRPFCHTPIYFSERREIQRAGRTRQSSRRLPWQASLPVLIVALVVLLLIIGKLL